MEMRLFGLAVVTMEMQPLRLATVSMEIWSSGLAVLSMLILILFLLQSGFYFMQSATPVAAAGRSIQPASSSPSQQSSSSSITSNSSPHLASTNQNVPYRSSVSIHLSQSHDQIHVSSVLLHVTLTTQELMKPSGSGAYIRQQGIFQHHEVSC